MKIHNCVDVITSYSSVRLEEYNPKRSKTSSLKEYFAVSISNLNETRGLYLNTDNAKKVYADANLETLKAGDVLITNRNKISVAVVSDDAKTPLIARDFLTVLRINKYFKKDLLPEFLAVHFLRSNVQHKILRSSATISRSLVIPVAEILDSSLHIPNISKQRKKINCYNTLEELKQQYAHKIELLNTIQKGILK
jgi:restriction endonuclease S subunit